DPSRGIREEATVKPIARILAVILVVTLLVGCSNVSRWARRFRLPKKGPVDIFIDIIDQVRGIGRSLSRQIQRMTGGRR
ncbi:MAG: hypothetical protein ACP5JG_07265, partial [Anaerolineae bacterium]